MTEWIASWLNGCHYGCMDGLMAEWMASWLDGWPYG